MRKIVIDTNVIVSALIGSSYPRQILYNLVFEKKVIVCTSTDVFKEYIIIPDEPDNRILELAVTAKADYIVTGNIRHFNFTQYEGIKIISPEQLVSLLLKPN